MMDMNDMTKVYRLSKLYWLSFVVTYIYCVVTVYLIHTLGADYYDTSNPQQVLSAMKLSTVRMYIISIGLIIYPIVLLISVRIAKYVTLGLTAWAVAMLIDDHLVLYEIIEYPERASIAAILELRPFIIVAMVWMCFELTFRTGN
jgi:hypothetical protein